MPVRAAVMTEPGADLETWTFDEPVPGQGEVVLETIASEVCGTDVHLHHGRLAGVPYPIIPGHVSVGRVAESRGVDRDFAGAPLSEGDVVTFYDVHGTCHRCWQCLIADQPNLCPNRRVYGITFSAEEGLLGGWSERIALKAGTLIVKVPEPLSADDVIGGGCGLFTGFGAVERSDLGLGDTVLVQGSGPVGLSAAAFAALGGAGQVVVIGDPEPRLELAARLGADATLSLASSSVEERAARVRELTAGRGPDVVIEASGSPEAIPEGLDLLRPGGTYVVAGHYTDRGPVEINPHLDLNAKHAQVRGRWGTEMRHVVASLTLLARHRERLPFADVIGGRYPIDEAGRALADVEALRVTKAIITP